MNEAQQIDYAYHAERLLLLIARRGKLPAGSDQISALDAEIVAVEDLVRSYRLVSGHGLTLPTALKTRGLKQQPPL
jgi:hypothetical protein